jgi:hypothetical protein
LRGDHLVGVVSAKKREARFRGYPTQLRTEERDERSPGRRVGRIDLKELVKPREGDDNPSTLHFGIGPVEEVLEQADGAVIDLDGV